MKKLILITVAIVALVPIGLYVKQVIHETVKTQKPGEHYLVSFGDSVAAGAGLNSQAGRKAGDCNLSEKAYPNVLATKRNASLEQFACSGAVVKSSKTDNTLFAQFVGAENFLPGSDVVLTAGANDVGWLQALTLCVQAECDTDANRNQLESKLPSLQENLSSFLRTVQTHHPRRVVVNTYYSLLAPGDSCFANSGITAGEVDFIVTEEAKLNEAITAAATAENAAVVAVDFSDHALCNPEPWIQGVLDPAPLHPTAAGQQQIAEQDFRALQ